MATDILILGGGLAGLAAAAALGKSGQRVRVLEMRGFLGGRATSYPVPQSTEEIIDNCQHILLRCCVNLLDFYKRLGVEDKIEFHREFFFLEPGGRASILKSGMLPAPLHFTGAFLGMQCLTLGDKIGIGKAILAIKTEYKSRRDLDSITMMDWLREKKQSANAIERFWRQVLVSAINEELDAMAAIHGLQVFYLGFLASSNSYEMGIPAVPLAELYDGDVWSRIPGVEIVPRAAVETIQIENGRVSSVTISGGQQLTADIYLSALPFERLATIVPSLVPDGFGHSPITGIHLWFDRPITNLPHATLLDRTMQWMFNKGDGKHIQLVVSASRQLTNMPRQQVIDLAVKELGEFFPAVAGARLEKAHVVKEVRATFAAAPGLESRRPTNKTSIPNLYLAGDWTRSGWPATMEGAVRSGYLAAEAITGQSYCLPDIA
ncbi:phytoene dehydrogenase [Bryobacterales bacterium F-183]|nr:phytoene dehydrogenase [Bryobacterales bacterium F-183]